MGSDDAMDQATAAVLDHNKHTQKTKGRRHGHEEIAGNNSLTVQAKEPSRYCERLSSHSSSKWPKNWGRSGSRWPGRSVRSGPPLSVPSCGRWYGLGTILSVWALRSPWPGFWNP